MFTDYNLLELAIGERCTHSLQVSAVIINALFGIFDKGFHSWFCIVNIGLVCLPLLFAACILADVLFCIVLQHCILTARELSNGITEYIFFLLKHTIGHTVCHHLLAVHNAVGNRALCFQSLICGNVQTVLNTKAQHTHSLTHSLVQVSLSQDTSITLCVVHRSIRSIKMYQCVQSLLYVHTCTEGKGRAEDNTYLTTIYLFKDFEFLLYGHSRLDYYNLIGRDTLSNKFGANVLVQVETALLVLVVVGKDGNSTLIVRTLFERTQGLSYSLVSLALGVVLCIRLHQSSINGCCFGNAVHREWNMAVLFLLLSAHLVVSFKFSLDILHNATQSTCLWQIEVLRLSSLHIGDFVAHASCLFGKNSIGHSRPYTHQLGKIDVTGKAVVLLELATCGKLQHLLDVTEVAHKVVKVVDAVLLHSVCRHKVTHKRPYLGSGVTDRCACGEDYVSSVVLLQYRLCLQEHALRLLAV